VFITKGLLKRLRNEAELAAVLGHEIAHISEKHMLKIIQRQKQLAGIRHLMPDTFKGVVDNAVGKLLDEGLDQRKELAADRLGVHFATRVGYDPNAYNGLLKRLRALKGDNRAMFKTHPNFSSRIKVVETTIGSLQHQTRRARLAKRFSNRTHGRL
jgi:predicted Zn-dependent protease